MGDAPPTVASLAKATHSVSSRHRPTPTLRRVFTWGLAARAPHSADGGG